MTLLKSRGGHEKFPVYACGENFKRAIARLIFITKMEI